MDTRIKQLGLSLGVAAIFAVGYIATSGQYVPPVNRANTVATSTICSTGERPEWDGSAWQCRGPNDYRSKHLEFSHDFLSAGASSTHVSDWLALNLSSGTGATATSTSTTTRPGISDFQTGTTSTGRAGLSGGSASLWRPAAYASLMFELIGGWPTLSTSSEEYATLIGFGNTSSTINQAEGCFMLYDRGNVATGGPNSGNASKLSCWCCASSTCTKFLMDGSTVSNESFTTVDTPVAALALPDTNIYRMRTVITPGTRAEFYVDSGSGLTKRCDINTNLPTFTNHEAIIVKSAGTTSRSFYVDWAHLTADMLSARSL